MNIRIIAAAGAAAILSAPAYAGNVQDRKAEEMCTGQKTTDDYPRWALTTNACSDASVTVCAIERNDGEKAQYQCTPADRSADTGGDTSDGDGDGDSSSGSGGRGTIRQY